MSLDFSKPENLQLRGGREFRIYATDHDGLWPVVGAIKIYGRWFSESWKLNGMCDGYAASDRDLIPKKPKSVSQLKEQIKELLDKLRDEVCVDDIPGHPSGAAIYEIADVIGVLVDEL